MPPQATPGGHLGKRDSRRDNRQFRLNTASPGQAKVNTTPVKLERLGDGGLVIEWSDGERRRYMASGLRDACPCATCREKRTAAPVSPLMLPMLSPEEARPTTILSMQPAGSYAYSIRFSDGHHSGLFTLEYLRELGEQVG
jgi:DUF971 family protein